MPPLALKGDMEIKETSKDNPFCNYKVLYAVGARPQGVEYLSVQNSEEHG